MRIKLAALCLALPLTVAGCDAASRFFTAAAPVAADALASYQARARALAPSLPADDPRLDQIATRLAALETAKAREAMAATCEAATDTSTDAVALTKALEEAAKAKAEASQARAELAAALRSAAPAAPLIEDAGTDGGGGHP